MRETAVCLRAARKYHQVCYGSRRSAGRHSSRDGARQRRFKELPRRRAAQPQQPRRFAVRWHACGTWCLSRAATPIRHAFLAPQARCLHLFRCHVLPMPDAAITRGFQRRRPPRLPRRAAIMFSPPLFLPPRQRLRAPAKIRLMPCHAMPRRCPPGTRHHARCFAWRAALITRHATAKHAIARQRRCCREALLVYAISLRHARACFCQQFCYADACSPAAPCHAVTILSAANECAFAALTMPPMPYATIYADLLAAAITRYADCRDYYGAPSATLARRERLFMRDAARRLCAMPRHAFFAAYAVIATALITPAAAMIAIDAAAAGYAARQPRLLMPRHASMPPLFAAVAPALMPLMLLPTPLRHLPRCRRVSPPRAATP